MCNYYTHVSLSMKLPDKVAQAYAIEVHRKARDLRDGDTIGEHWSSPNGCHPDCPACDFPDELMDLTENWCFEAEPDAETGIWIHSVDGGIDAIMDFIQHLLIKFDPTGRVEFEWSEDCDKPRLDAFGGGAAVVTATESHWMNTAQWLLTQRPKDQSKTLCEPPKTS